MNTAERSRTVLLGSLFLLAAMSFCGRTGIANTPDEQLRAGCPRMIAPWARPFPDSSYKGYYIGGGAPLTGRVPSLFRGAGRYPDEGTFGVDYVPWRSKVQLRWYHGRRLQGGEGQYATEKE